MVSRGQFPPHMSHQGNNLFLALVPQGETGVAVESIAHRLKVKYRLTGRLLGLPRYHVSLLSLGDFAEVSSDLIARTREKFAPIAARTEPFQIRFDQSLSFRSKKPKCPFVLTGSRSNAAFSQLLNQLGSRLGRSRRCIDPHLTLLYDEKSIGQYPAYPVSWIVNELVLVRSYVGLGRHEHLARWPLSGECLWDGLWPLPG